MIHSPEYVYHFDQLGEYQHRTAATYTIISEESFIDANVYFDDLFIAARDPNSIVQTLQDIISS
jgi:hypothetical protein